MSDGQDRMAADAAFRAETYQLLCHAYDALAEVLLAPDRVAKHPPYTWQDEPDDEHLRKAVRHVLTHQLVRDDQAPPSAEDHLHRAVVRLLMALAKRDDRARRLGLPNWMRHGLAEDEARQDWGRTHWPGCHHRPGHHACALERLRQYEVSARARVYVAGAYNDDNVLGVLHNMRRGMQAAVAVLTQGMAPFCPWHDFHHTLMQQPRHEVTIDDYYEFSTAWLDAADAVLLVDPEDHPRTRTSRGTVAEIARARDLGIPVFDDLVALCRWRDEWRKERQTDEEGVDR